VASRSRMDRVAGIGSGNPVPCLGRPQKRGSTGPINTCPIPATKVLVCTAWAQTETAPAGGPVDLIVGMCDDHRAVITAWAWRRWNELGEGLVLDVDALPDLVDYLGSTSDPDRELVALAAGEDWQRVS
jgi:hypothetical protein